MRLLVSVRSIDEAMAAAQGGADFIDLKEPGHGALGALPIDVIQAVVAALRQARITLPVSATIGDVPMAHLDEIQSRVSTVGACGVDYVKVGIEAGSPAYGVLDALARDETPVVPVLLADRGIDTGLLRHACALGFEAVMVDTADKAAGSLLRLLPSSELAGFVSQVREAGALVGLAGALQLADVPALQVLGPDFAGFRSAVCQGHRSGPLDSQRVRGLARVMHGESTA